MIRELTIIGLGPSRKECPFATEELWGVHRCILEPDLQDKKFTKIFSLDPIYQTINDHPPMEIKSISQAIERAKELNIPVVSHQDYATEVYPLREIVNATRASYFGTTVSYMIAYALFNTTSVQELGEFLPHVVDGYKKLHLYGIDQGPELVYQTGKPPICFWLGFARARGVEVSMGRGSLKWTYNPGLDKVPFPFVKEEYEQFYRERVSEAEMEKLGVLD